MKSVERKGAIVWAVPDGTVAPGEEVESVLADLTVELKRGMPYVLLFDLTRAAIPSALQRQKLAAHMQDNAARIRRWVLGIGIIYPNALTRGVVTAIFWIAPPPVPYRFFATRVEAAEWAGSLVEAPRSL
jgi:hypothetical protein